MVCSLSCSVQVLLFCRDRRTRVRNDAGVLSENIQQSGFLFFFFQAEDGIRDLTVTGVQTCALPISLSRFTRIEAEYRIEHSNRFDVTRPDLIESSATEFHRVGWLASNYVSYVRDNTLWLPTGPIDGVRMNLTGGLVNDMSHGRFDTCVVTGDYRRYLRTSLRSALAVRLLGYYAGGERPRRVNIGGSWGLRGHPRYGYVAGTRGSLLHSRWR